MTVEETCTAAVAAAVEPTAVQTEITKTVPSDALLAKILKQVEFYFGDANLPRDKFLQEKIKENDGWVDLSVLASFSRMKALSEDVSVIAEALGKSSDLLELNEARTCVRRTTDLPEPRDNMTTSVYIKGFPLTATLDEIQAFLESVAFEGKILAVRMRRHPKTKTFKGSVFVELESAEKAESLASMTLSLPDSAEPLCVMIKAQYFEKKNAEKTAAKAGKEEEEEVLRPMEYTKGCLVIYEAVPEDITFGALKEALNAHKEVAFANIENSVATVRFKEAIPTEESLPEAISTFTIGEAQLTGRKASEEEEKAYYDAFLKSMRARSAAGRKFGRRGGRGGRPKRPRTN